MFIRIQYRISNELKIENLEEIGDWYADVDCIYQFKAYYFHPPMQFRCDYQAIYIHGVGVIYGENRIALLTRLVWSCLVAHKHQSFRVFVRTVQNVLYQ